MAAPVTPTLVRGLTLGATLAILVGNVIGTGVFLKARVMTCNVGDPRTVLMVWVAAGLLSLAGALTYAELAAMMPRAGGEYVYLRRAYGPAAGFLYGWMQFLIAKSGALASLAIAFATFLNVLTGQALKGTVFTLPLPGFDLNVGWQQVTAIAAIAVATLINCAAVAVSGRIAVVLTAIKVLLILGLGAAAFLLGPGDWSHFLEPNQGGACAGVSPAACGGAAGFGAAMLGALWAYDGWNNLTMVGGEVQAPQRNLPLALIGGMVLIMALYLFVNAAYFYVLTPTQVASVSLDSAVATEAAQRLRFFGPIGVSLTAAAMLCSCAGALHTSVLTGARVPYAMAHDGLLTPRLGRLSRRTRVPVAALTAQGVWAGLLTLSGSYDTLTDYVMFASWLFYGLTAASIFVFRRRMPDAERPYRAWGYPVVPVLFLATTGWLLVNTLQTQPLNALTGLGLLAVGLPVFYYGSRRLSRRVEPKSG